MKNLPEQTIEEIAKPFLERSGFKVEEIRNRLHRQEIAWVRAKISIAAYNAGWGYSAIGRYLGVGHDTVLGHVRDERRKHE